MNKVTILVAFFGLVAARNIDKYNYNDEYDNDFSQDDEYHDYLQTTDDKDFHSEPHYSFGYEVHDEYSGDIKSHYEERKGDHTQGMYTLVEPGGSKRIVQYFVKGKSGFNAKVEREATKHPREPSPSSQRYHDEETVQSPAPSHSAHLDAPPNGLRQYDVNPPNRLVQYDEAPSSTFGQRLVNYKPHISRKPSLPGTYRSKSINRPQSKHRHNDDSAMAYLPQFNSLKKHHKPASVRQHKMPLSQQSFLKSSYLSDRHRHRDTDQNEHDTPARSHATSSVKFVTNGASLSTVTNHVMPESQDDYYY